MVLNNAALTNASFPESLDGRSQRPLLEGAQQWEDDRIMFYQVPHYPRNRIKWKNVSFKTQNYRMNNPDKLYDVRNGDTEVSRTHPEVHSRLVAAYDAYWESLPDEEDITEQGQLR